MSNLLSHDNTIIENLSIKEIEEFCFGVYDLHNMLLCPNCNKLFNIIRENDNDDKEQKERDTPYKYSTEIPRRRWRGINLR